MRVLVTGAAGFIGHAVSAALLDRGDAVVGVDNFNDSYDVGLKRHRLAELTPSKQFTFAQLDVSSRQAVEGINSDSGPFSHIVHLAAQAGVRKSTEQPYLFLRDNIDAHLNMLELCRATDGFEHLVFASSSSVYGANPESRSSIEHPVARPMSLYGATKAADELISYSYSHLFGIPQTALRFFTVYGVWGRPDMVIYLFTRLIDQGKPITVYNSGDMNRDFTYIDDVVDGVLRALDRIPQKMPEFPPFRVYNLGRGKSETLESVISCIERELGKKAERILAPKHVADPQGSLADISLSEADLGYSPRTDLKDGIAKFVAWYRGYCE